MKCVELHARTRAIPEAAPFWVCAYAIREHAPENLLGNSLDQSGCFTALQTCTGMLLVLSVSESISPLSRTWCVFEIAVAVRLRQEQRETLVTDVALENLSRVELLTAGITEKERELEEKTPGSGNWAKECREKAFPLDSLCAGLSVAIESTQTTDEVDFANILNCVIGQGGRQAPPPLEHVAYLDISRQVRAEVALAAWRKALLRGPGAVAILRLPEVLRADERREALSLDFFACDEMKDAELVSLAMGLPPNLVKFELSLLKCSHIGNRGAQSLCDSLPRGLRTLLLDFSCCGDVGDATLVTLAENLSPSLESLCLRFKSVKGKITDRGVEALSKALVECHDNLVTLELDFAANENIGDAGVEALSAHMPHALQRLHLDFWMCGDINDDGIHEMAARLPPTLVMLCLRFTGARGNITDKGLTSLSSRLPSTLESLKLDLQYFDRLGDVGMDALGHHMPPALHTLQLKIEGCDKVSDHGVSDLLDKIPAELHTLLLHFEFCNQITSDGVSAIAEKLLEVNSLQSLTLNFGCCGEIKDQGLVALSERLPSSLERLQLDFKYCKKLGDMGLAALGKSLPASLLHLSLHFGFCELIYDAGICELAQGLPGTLQTADINFWRCTNVGDTGIMHIAKSLPTAIRNLQLTVDGTKVTPAKRAFCTGVDSMRRCKPTEQELFAPMGQPHRIVVNPSRIGWLRRHGPPLEGVDALLADEPVLQSTGRSIFGPLGSTGKMSRSESCPSFRRKAPPAAVRVSLPKA